MARQRQWPNVRQVVGGRRARLHLLLNGLVTGLSVASGRRGLQRAVWTIGKRFPDTDAVIVALGPDISFRFRLNDGYWAKLLSPGFAYEPDVEWAFTRCVLPGTYFLDCGANLGYWSVRAVARTQGERVVAVEATPSTYEQLLLNRELSAAPFVALNRGLWRTD